VSTKHSLNNQSYVLKYKDPNFFDKPDVGGFDNIAYFAKLNDLDDYPPASMNVNHLGASIGLVFRIGAGGAGPGVKKTAKEPVIPPPMPKEELETGRTFILNNIYYDFDKCDLRQDAFPELDRLVDILKENPAMEIELSSHTDQRGAGDYNQRLSQCRAESARKYLISKGITASRITAVGYGESRLLKDCSTDPSCGQTGDTDCPCHQNNRRTEVKILKM
jgi:outer membrane protein OmpA-like peptidoglycan-associated protein